MLASCLGKGSLNWALVPYGGPSSSSSIHTDNNNDNDDKDGIVTQINHFASRLQGGAGLKNRVFFSQIAETSKSSVTLNSLRTHL